MGFYKPGANHVQDPKMARLHKMIWTLVFGGLITIILGIFVERAGDAIGWMMVVAGSVLTAIGVGLIYVRSTMSTETK